MFRLTIDGYGQFEPNRINIDNRESQCELSEVDFPDGAENGTIVGIDKVNRALVKPADEYVKGILFNAEVLYNQYAMGLKNFKVAAGATGSVLYIKNNELFTTNNFGADEGDFADEDALIAALEDLGTTPLYAKFDADGMLQITPTAAGAMFDVVKWYNLPDGQPAAKFRMAKESLMERQ